VGFYKPLPKTTSTPHANRVGGETASEQAVTLLRDTRALLLRSKKWTKSSLQTQKKRHMWANPAVKNRCYDS
jgi:hypothetical protein